MKLLFISLYLIVCVLGFSQKSYTVNYSTNITIDGDLSDWDLIPFTDEFVDHDLGTITNEVQSTKAKLAWDDDNLYVAFLALDRDMSTTDGEQDAAIFSTDDLVEIFIDADGNGIDYIEIGANAEEVYYDYVLECVSSTCGGWKDNQAFDLQGFDVKASYIGTLNNVVDTDVQYVIEFKIPFTALNAIPNGGFSTPLNGDKWKANLFRVDPNVWHGTEYLSWSPHNSFGFHQPAKFGELVFSDAPITGLSSSVISSLDVYPNPTQGIVNFSKEVSQITIYNSLGDLMKTSKNVNELNLSGFDQGVYVFNMIVEGSVVIEKVIVE